MMAFTASPSTYVIPAVVIVGLLVHRRIEAYVGLR